MSSHSVNLDDFEVQPLTETQIEDLRQDLERKRLALLQRAAPDRTEAEQLADEGDRATEEYTKDFGHRLRDRERGLLMKISNAMRRMEAGEYEECETCGDLIGYARLRARPEANLCIECKEEQETNERRYLHRRLRNDDPFFSF